LQTGRSSFSPGNIAETAEAYHVELNAPGRNKEDFKIKDKGYTISYEKKEEITKRRRKNDVRSLATGL